MDVRANTPTSVGRNGSSSPSMRAEVRAPQETEHVSLASIQSAIKSRLPLGNPQLTPSTTGFLNDREIRYVGSSETQTERAEELDGHVKKILCNSAEQLAAIEQKRLSAIQQVETNAKNAQAFVMMRGMSAAIGSDIETKKNNDLRKIEQQAMRERMTLLIKSKSALQEDQKTLFKKIFEDYSARLASFPKFSEKFIESQKNVEKIFSKDQEILPIEDPERATDEKLQKTLTALLEHDVARFDALKPLVRLSINAELNKIETRFNSLENFIQQSRENAFIDLQHLMLLHDQFVSAKQAFFVAEAVDCRETRSVALKNEEALQVFIQELQQKIEGASQAVMRARSSDQVKLTQKIELLKKLVLDLTTAQQAWKQIAADSKLRVKTKNLDPPFFDLNILSQLETIPVSQDNYLMVARRGEIEVARPRELLENRKLYREANELIRLAIFRDFGGDALKRFDDEKRDDLVAGNPLTVAQLKKFLKKEAMNNPPAFYLSSVHPFREIIFSSVPPDSGAKAIKGDAAVFKMFSTSPSSETALSEEQKEKLAFDTVRMDLVECFKNLPEANQLFMLKRFDDQFSKGAKEKKPLTVQDVKKFFNAELKRQQSYFMSQDIIGPVLSSIASNVGTMLLENIASLPVISRVAPVVLLVAGLAMGVSGDMSRMWQQLRGRHPWHSQR